MTTNFFFSNIKDAFKSSFTGKVNFFSFKNFIAVYKHNRDTLNKSGYNPFDYSDAQE